MPEGRCLGAAVLVACAASVGCTSLLPLLPPAFASCREPVLATPASLGADFRWRSRASLREGGEERAALELVVEKRADRVVLLAFDRTGLRLLSAVQEGTALHSEPVPGRPRAVTAETLLADFARMRVPEHAEADLVVRRDVTPEGEPRVTLHDARCGTEAVYVTTEERLLPESG